MKKRKRSLYPSPWSLNKKGVRWTEPPTEGNPIRTWSEFSAAEQTALLVKLRQWLDPDVNARRRHGYAHSNMGLSQL